MHLSKSLLWDVLDGFTKAEVNTFLDCLARIATTNKTSTTFPIFESKLSEDLQKRRTYASTIEKASCPIQILQAKEVEIKNLHERIDHLSSEKSL